MGVLFVIIMFVEDIEGLGLSSGVEILVELL